jgi:LEA14-like dessication related protein
MSILTNMVRDSKFHIKYWALGFSLLLLIGSCKPKEDIVLRGVRDIIVDANTEPTLKANAVLYNPNNVKIKLRKIAIDVYVNGKKSGVVDQEPRMTIPAAAEFTVPLEVKLNMKELGLFDTIFGMIGGKKMKVKYKGSISVTYKGLPIRIPVDYESEVRFKL